MAEIHDLRSALEFLRTQPGQLLETDTEVDCDAEVSGVYRHVGAGGTVKRPTKEGPAMLFNNVKGFDDAKVCIGMLSSRKRVAALLGMSETEFAPNLDITREQFTAIMYRYARYRGNTDVPAGELTGFADADSVSSWAKDAMSWSFGKGILKGMGDGKIEPQGTTTRAQAAAFFHRLMKVLG